MTGPEAVAALPDAIRVGPFDLRIEKWARNSARASSRWGEFSAIEQVIRIDECLPSAVKAVNTVLHETSHAIFWAYGIEDEDKEERVVGAFGTAWTQIYRDNPWLLDWIGRALA